VNKLTREQIQALSNYEIDSKLSFYFYRSYCFDGLVDELTEDKYHKWVKQKSNKIYINDFCDSLDAQFACAKEFNDLGYSFDYSPAGTDMADHDYLFEIRNLSKPEFDLKRSGQNVRIGAELLLEAVQRLEEVK